MDFIEDEFIEGVEYSIEYDRHECVYGMGGCDEVFQLSSVIFEKYQGRCLTLQYYAFKCNNDNKIITIIHNLRTDEYFILLNVNLNMFMNVYDYDDLWTNNYNYY